MKPFFNTQFQAASEIAKYKGIPVDTVTVNHAKIANENMEHKAKAKKQQTKFVDESKQMVGDDAEHDFAENDDDELNHFRKELEKWWLCTVLTMCSMSGKKLVVRLLNMKVKNLCICTIASIVLKPRWTSSTAILF